MSEASNFNGNTEVISYWPARPEGCPPASAYRIDQDMYRFVEDGDKDAWCSYAMINGEEKYAKAKSEHRCMAHALSVYPTPQSAFAAKELKLGRFRNHKIVRFRIDNTMGVVSAPNKKTSHTSWWPSQTFTPPPSPVFLAKMLK